MLRSPDRHLRARDRHPVGVDPRLECGEGGGGDAVVGELRDDGVGFVVHVLRDVVAGVVARLGEGFSAVIIRRFIGTGRQSKKI